MARPRNSQNRTKKFNGLNLRKLQKELKLIPFDIKREIRFLDLLFSERNSVRTQVEKDVLRELIDRARKMVEYHQNRLDRYEECYRQLKETKSFDRNLLYPDELQSMLQIPPKTGKQESEQNKQGLRTGTDG